MFCFVDKILRKKFSGATVLEVVVAVGIFSMVVFSMTAILFSSFKMRDVIWEQLSTQNEGRRIVQDFVNELRSANYSSIGAYPLESASTSSIVFYSNIDTDSWRERVRYFLSGTTLSKGITKPTSTPLRYATTTDEVITEIVHDIANGTSTPVFYYYGQDYAGTSTPMTYPVDVSDVRVVGIKLTLEENPRLSPAPFTIETKASIRNLKSN